MNEPIVVIITLNYNQSRMTLDCIDSIFNSTYDNFELIVIDNGSIYNDYNFLRENVHPKATLLRLEDNCGYVGGINFGLRKSIQYDPEFIMIMNNDTVIDSDAIRSLVKTAINYDSRAIVSGKVYFFDRPKVFQYTGSYFSNRNYLTEYYPGKNEKDQGQMEKEEERDMLDDVFWLIPVNVYLDVGLYSDNFFLYGEQADYALRAVKMGYKLVYCPKAKIWHKGSMTTGGGDGSTPAVNFWRNKSSVIFLFRNLKKRFFLLKSTKTALRLGLKNTLNLLGLRKSKNKKSDFAALIGFLYGIEWIFSRRKDKGYNPFLK
jgi:GT2 family glycosyltransferase